MLSYRTIVLSVMGAITLWGCGQKGPLYLPSEPEAAHRATLPRAVANELQFRKDVPTPPALAPNPSASAPIQP